MQPTEAQGEAPQVPSFPGVTPALQIKTAKTLLRYLLLLVMGAAFYGESKTKVLKRGFTPREVPMPDGSHMTAGQAWSTMLEAVLQYREHIGELRSPQKTIQILKTAVC